MSTNKDSRRRYAEKPEYWVEWRKKNAERVKKYQAAYRERKREERDKERERKAPRYDMMSAAALFRRKADRAHFMWLYEYFNNKKQQCKT